MRIALGISYNGAHFSGWQSQPSGTAIQDHLERALTNVAASEVRLTAAGRTDAGVHATGQVAHFDTAAERPLTAWVRGVNARLPNPIAVQWAQPMTDDFHARFAALARTYHYVLYIHPVRPALLAGQVGWFHRPLDVQAMRAGAAELLGTHDFSSFRAAECQAKTPVRTLSLASIRLEGAYIIFTFRADAFLHHMIRNIVGCLVYVGQGKRRSTWMKELLDMRDRTRGAPTFGAQGLYLTHVEYDRRWDLPYSAQALLPGFTSTWKHA